MVTTRPGWWRALALLPVLPAMLSLSCRPICEGVDGSCLELRVEGASPYTHLQVSVGIPQPVAIKASQAEGGDFALPLTMRVVPPPGTDSTDIDLINVELTDVDRRRFGFARLEDVKWPTDSVLQASAGVIAFARVDAKVLSNPQSAVVADINRDGILDVVVVSASSNSLQVMLGQGGAQFSSRPAISTIDPVGLIAARLTASGHLDLAVANRSANTASVFLGNSSGTFLPAPGSPYAVGRQPAGVAAGDFNGDQLVDLAVTSNGAGTVEVLSGLGAGSFKIGTPVVVGAGSKITSVIAADWNRDGLADLAVAEQQPNTLLNAAILLGKTGMNPVLGSHLVPGFVPVALVAADVNTDGNLDLIVAQFFAAGLSVALGRGDGSFDPAIRAAPGLVARPSSVTALDINQDGVLDLVAVLPVDTQSPAVAFNRIGVFTGKGDGTFRMPSFIDTLASPSYVTSGDFDNDGAIDLLVVNQGDSSISVFLNRSNGF